MQIVSPGGTISADSVFFGASHRAHGESADLPAQQTPALPIKQQRNRWPSRRASARNGPHVGHPKFQAFQNWICKGRVKAGQDPSRVKRGEGD
jgi:hypothetical protein